MKSMKKFTLIMISSLSLFILMGCQNINQFSPEQVIANALEESDQSSYYGEVTISYNGFEDMDDMVMKEWRQEDRTRVEVNSETVSSVFIYDGKKFSMLDAKQNKAMMSEEMEEGGLYMDPRQQVEMLLKNVQDTHEVETVGEEKIAGRETIHMTAKQKDGTKSIHGDQEWWIDKENWIILKTKLVSGDAQLDMEYTKIDFNPKFDDTLFELDIPDDVEVEEFGNLLDEGEEITLEDIPDKLEQAVFYIPSEEAHEIETIMFIEMGGELTFKDVTIDYKQNGLPVMSLTLIQTETEEVTEIPDGIGEKVSIRGVDGLFIDEAAFRHLSWAEEGINYSIHLIDPNLTLEDVLKWADEMEEIN